MQAPFGYVYRITNLVTGETYIGQRKLSLDTSWRQYMGSGRLVKSAIDELGASLFVKTFLGYASTPDLLSSLEEQLIAYEKDVLMRGEYNQARIVRGPQVASRIGAEAASQKAKRDKDKHYFDFLERHSQEELTLAFSTKPTAILLAEALSEPLSLVKRWMTENMLVDSPAHSGQVKSTVRKTVKNKAISARSKAMWADPEKRAAIVQAQSGRKRSAEHRANISKSHTRIVLTERKCLWCEETFLPKKARVQFCSTSCAAYARHNGLRRKL